MSPVKTIILLVLLVGMLSLVYGSFIFGIAKC